MQKVDTTALPDEYEFALRQARALLVKYPWIGEQCEPRDVVQSAYVNLLALTHSPKASIRTLVARAVKWEVLRLVRARHSLLIPVGSDIEKLCDNPVE